MEERVIQFRVGVMVLATLIVTAILVVMFGELPTLIHGTYTVHVTFREAPGVTKDTPVRKSGILIGRVTNVELNPDRTVTVTAQIERRRPLYRDEVCRIDSSLLGDTFLEFVRSPKLPLSEEPIEDGAQLKGEVKLSPLGMIDQWEDRISAVLETVTTAGEALTTASSHLGDAAEEVSDLLKTHKEGIVGAIDKANSSLDALGKAADSMNNLVGDEATQKDLRAAVAELPETIRSMRRTMTLAETSLKDLREFTEPLREGGRDRIERVFSAIDQLDRTMSELAVFSQRLNRQEGSLGRFINDPELYNHVNNAAKRIDDLSRKLEPILDDARVFSDKIARHPELLGVRGAIQRNPGIK